MVNNGAKRFYLTKKALEDDPFESFYHQTPFSYQGLLSLLLFEELLVLTVELIDATSAVNKFHLTSIEGM